MAEPQDTIRSRWRSRRHVGESKPTMTVEIRTGRFFRRYDAWDDGAVPVEARIPTQGDPWQAFWTPNTDYQEVPNVKEVSLEQDLVGTNGVQSATIVLDNIAHIKKTGIAGVFHEIERGYFAPLRGYQAPGRPNIGKKKNEWFDLLQRKAQVTISQGYGDKKTITFTGLINDIDLTSSPDRIVITARDFGQTLTDQRLFGWVKDRGILDPITFADRRRSDQTTRTGGGAGASTSTAGHPPRFVNDNNRNSYWEAERIDLIEYVEIRLPAGRYDSFILYPFQRDMEVWVSLFAKGDAGAGLGSRGSELPKRDGQRIPEGWIGSSDVPNRDVPFIKTLRPEGSERSYSLGASYEVGDNSILRIWCRHKQRRPAVRTLNAVRRRRDPQARTQKWILVDDLADIVKVVLRWAGFKEWEIETTGTSLTDKVVFDRSTYMIDIIKKVTETTGFVFYIKPPKTNGSIGIPVLRESTPIQESRQEQIELVTDENLLTGIDCKISDEPLASVIRVRGKQSDSEGSPLGGTPAGRIKRFQFTYRPPWSQGEADDRLAGIIKHTIHRNNLFTSNYMCHLACLKIAYYQALESAKATCQIPGYPYFHLDELLAFHDLGTGLNTRLWLADKRSTFVTGEDASWVMTVSGALVDTPDIVDLKAEIAALLRRDSKRTDGPQSRPSGATFTPPWDIISGGTQRR